MKNKNHFPEVLRKLIDKRKLPAKECAARLCVSRSTLSNYLNGNSEPSISSLIKLSEILNVSLDYLLTSQESSFKSHIPLSKKNKYITLKISYEELEDE